VVQALKAREPFLEIGNLEAKRDWGHAKDYVRAMWLILQQESSDDFVCATGISHTVRELVEYVFEKIDLDWRPYVRIDTKYFRPEELEDLKGDSAKLRKSTGWEPTYTFESMLDEMIEYWMLHYQA
jgi:GDPmannose 4,6-dehydratase